MLHKVLKEVKNTWKSTQEKDLRLHNERIGELFPLEQLLVLQTPDHVTGTRLKWTGVCYTNPHRFTTSEWTVSDMVLLNTEAHI